MTSLSTSRSTLGPYKNKARSKYSLSHLFRRNTKSTKCNFAFFLGSHDRIELCTQFHAVITLLLNFADFTLKCKSRVLHGDVEMRNGVQYRQIFQV